MKKKYTTIISISFVWMILTILVLSLDSHILEGIKWELTKNHPYTCPQCIDEECQNGTCHCGELGIVCECGCRG